MTRLRRALLIAALSLLPSTAPASAEWWAEWAYHFSPSTREEKYASGAKYSTRPDCEHAVQRYTDSLRGQGYSATGGSPGTPAVFVNNEGTALRFFCLPDTVDPRGAKGK